MYSEEAGFANDDMMDLSGFSDQEIRRGKPAYSIDSFVLQLDADDLMPLHQTFENIVGQDEIANTSNLFFLPMFSNLFQIYTSSLFVFQAAFLKKFIACTKLFILKKKLYPKMFERK